MISTTMMTIDDANEDVTVVPDLMEIEEDDNNLMIETIRLNQLLLKKSDHKDIMTHIAWPRYLPSKEKPELHKHETALIAAMADTIDVFEELLPTSTAKLFRGLYNINTSKDVHCIQSEINRLKCGEMLGIFVRHQSCGFLVYIPRENDLSVEPKYAIVSTFPVAVPANEIYDKENSDLQIDFPTESVKVEFSIMLNSLEFAKQLWYLGENEMKSTNKEEDENDENGNKENKMSAGYVSKWLLPMLTNCQSTTVTPEEFPIISKKIRDDVVGAKSLNSKPFRRSGYYTFLKVMLQLNLILELGDNGQVMYKLIMLKFMGVMSNLYNTKMYSTLDMDVVSLMLAKLARRIEKLNGAECTLNECLIGFQRAYIGTIDETKAIISQIRQKIDRQINALQTNEEISSELDSLSGLNFEGDVFQRVPTLRDYLKMRQGPATSTDNNENLRVKTHHRLYLNSTNVPDMNVFETLKDSVGLYLSDFENFILYKLDFGNDVHLFEPTVLRSWSFVYAAKAEAYYKGDQLGFSRIALTQLKILAFLDKIAIQKHALLKKHRAGINVDVFDELLLPQFTDVEIAHELKQYFRKRSSSTLKPGLIEEEQLSANSFSAEFAAKNSEMQNVRKRIHQSTEMRKAELRLEWEMQREEVAKLRKQLETLDCQYTVNVNGKRQHSNKCSYCKLLGKVLGCRIATFELPLPKTDYEENAVIFEARIPVEIACLRDVLYEVVRLFNEPTKKIRVFEKWIECNEIETFNISVSERVFLGTTVKSSSRKPRNRSIHPDSPVDAFTLQNSRNCVLYSSSDAAYHLSTDVNSQSMKKLTTLAVEQGSPYQHLQWTLDGTLHTQNQVLARQYECPQSLTLSEYKNFGSLRADGHRLQLRKLYAMIEIEALSFETDSVQSLIMQTIWEVGPGNALSRQWNESHEDFADLIFGGAMISLIERFIDTQKCNWKHPLKLLMTVLIAVRIFEMNEDNDLADRIVQLLMKLRSIAFDWIAKVHTAMQETEPQEDKEKLRINLVEIAIAGALTFFVHFHHQYFGKIFTGISTDGITAVRFWLEFLVTLNSNILMSSSKATTFKYPLKVNQRMLQKAIQRLGIQLESKIIEMISNDPTDLFEFIKSQWTTSKDGVFQLKLDPKYPQIVIVSMRLNNIEHFIQIDVITGEFLVNNLPVSRLPRIITEHLLFRRVFEQIIFEVQQESTSSFITKYNRKNSHYKFQVNQGDVLITERKNDDKEYELISNDLFDDEIPYLLVEKHSHWWNKDEKKIEFRPIRFSDLNFALTEGVEYELNLSNGTLKQMKTGKVMLDVTSESYNKIVNQLQRLESKKYIHIFMEQPNQAKVDIVRMNLKFIVDAFNQESSVYDVISNEFNGMRISSDQKCGTLYGLRQGLLLENIPNDATSTQSKMMILPHGKIDAKRNENHEIVEVDIESELRNPPFYTYQIDELLHQAKASNSSHAAWFYLAYLHALTSHGAPEPFIDMSGTERALQILQSGYVWSSAPYDNEALATLMLIAKLAPQRKNKNLMQSVRWPDLVHTHAAQDAFTFVTQQLLIDSKRLNELYVKDEKETKMDIDETMAQFDENKREYFRSLPFLPNLQVSDCFLQHKVSIASHYIHQECDENLRSIRMLSNLYHQNTFRSPKVFDLTEYLTMDRKSLKGSKDFEYDDEILDKFSMKDVRNLWISLYNVARTGQFSREKFALILGLLAHEGIDWDFNAILALQTVAANQDLFVSIEPPDVLEYDLDDRSFNRDAITKILESYKTKPQRSGRWSEERDIRYQLHLCDYIHNIVTKICMQWPCERVDSIILNYTHPDVNLLDAIRVVNRKLRDWRNIQDLMTFLRKVDMLLRLKRSMPSDSIADTVVPWRTSKLPFKNMQKFSINFDAKIDAHLLLFKKEVEEAERIYNRTISFNETNYTAEQMWNIYTSITQPIELQHLIDAGIYPRMVLSLTLPKLLSPFETPKLKAVIGAVAVQMVNEQRNRRIDIYSKQPQMIAAYEREKENVPHMNWIPCEFPEWLLFQIEQDLTIRRIQIEIAMRMIDPPKIGTKHSVMQLNMGEGKTAVIVPILACCLANGQQVCQVTVLKSLFATNLKALRQCLGGMLNHRVYTFPCRRDMPIKQYAEKILDIYVECRRLKGIILTLPEYRLSFQLKIYEAPFKGEIECAKLLFNIHKWINENVRNILDESDAILHPKYQLIYTLGEQLSLDGGAQRWTVVQSVLKRLPHHLRDLWKNYGNRKIEFDDNYARSGHVMGTSSMNFRSDVFTPCRILDIHIYEELKGKLIDDFIGGRMSISITGIAPAIKNILKVLLSDKDMPADTFEETIGKLTATQQSTILILSGLLRFDVLKLVLTKRWRVNYGVNEKGPRKMAIPFKAKDVAAEMTEFGHPDVAICLTHLSYYYSGLTDVQLHQVFTILGSQQNSTEIYESWINSIPERLVDDSIRSYTGVNLSDPRQRNQLVFPLLRHNVNTIDYWLSNLVFPREAKTFEHKLMCSAWDLCSDNLTHTVTGFSGTNDTKNILPLPISQNDLKELEKTNDNVRKILLLEENNGYVQLPANVRGMEILIRLSKSKIPVLLDAGACMLELNNKEVGQKWLTIVSTEYYDAALYFNANDCLMTIDRNGIITEFDNSAYRNKLDRCLVYLDDVHTRGTDLKFPLGWKACVTLSGEITRDKTVQACMRMRLLGKGHSIVFWASYEADVRIRQLCNLTINTRPTNKDVLEFVCQNSRRFEEDNIIHWSAAAFNYTKKLIAHKLYDESVAGDTNVLYEKCVDSEYVTLKDMYGGKEDAFLTQISQNKFNKILEAYGNNAEIVQFVKSIENGVQQKLQRQVPNLKRFTQTLDEEQEKELEHELEEQRQVERPLPAQPVEPQFDELLASIVKSGANASTFATIKKSQGIISVGASLADKQLFKAYKYFDQLAWAENLYVTRDFVQVIDKALPSSESDEFLRPTWWIARIEHRANDDIFILMSSYETDRLLPLFRKTTKSVLYMYRSRLSQYHNNLINDIALQVTQMDDRGIIGLAEEVQISVYSGSMYFRNTTEQNVYCGFLGLIPQPRTDELEKAFNVGIISPNGFVPKENRKKSKAISRCVGQCKFTTNPVELAIKLIEVNHQFIRKESHVASILEKSIKMEINEVIDTHQYQVKEEICYH